MVRSCSIELPLRARLVMWRDQIVRIKPRKVCCASVHIIAASAEVPRAAVGTRHSWVSFEMIVSNHVHPLPKEQPLRNVPEQLAGPTAARRGREWERGVGRVKTFHANLKGLRTDKSSRFHPGRRDKKLSRINNSVIVSSESGKSVRPHHSACASSIVDNWIKSEK